MSIWDAEIPLPVAAQDIVAALKVVRERLETEVVVALSTLKSLVGRRSAGLDDVDAPSHRHGP